MLHCLSWKIEIGLGGMRQVHVHIVCDANIRGGYPGTIITWGARQYNVINMVLDLLETVSSNGILSFEIWVEIQDHVRVGMMILQVAGEDLEINVNRNQKGCFWMRHGFFVGSSIVNELLLKAFQMKENKFGFI